MPIKSMIQRERVGTIIETHSYQATKTFNKCCKKEGYIVKEKHPLQMKHRRILRLKVFLKERVPR